MDFWAGGRTRARTHSHSHSFVHTKQTGGHRIVASPGSTCKLLRRLLIGRPVGQLLGLARALDQIAAGNSVDFGHKSRATQSRDSERWRETDEEGKRRATCGFCPDTNSTFPSHSPPPDFEHSSGGQRVAHSYTNYLHRLSSVYFQEEKGCWLAGSPSAKNRRLIRRRYLLLLLLLHLPLTKIDHEHLTLRHL